MFDWVLYRPPKILKFSLEIFNFFDRETNKYVWNKIEEATFADNDLLCFSIFIFKKKSWLYWKKQPFRKKCCSWELDCSNVDDAGNLEDSPRIVLIDEECGKLIVVNDVRELTRSINQKMNSDISQ